MKQKKSLTTMSSRKKKGIVIGCAVGAVTGVGLAVGLGVGLTQCNGKTDLTHEYDMGQVNSKPTESEIVEFIRDEDKRIQNMGQDDFDWNWSVDNAQVKLAVKNANEDYKGTITVNYTIVAKTDVSGTYTNDVPYGVQPSNADILSYAKTKSPTLNNSMLTESDFDWSGTTGSEAIMEVKTTNANYTGKVTVKYKVQPAVTGIEITNRDAVAAQYTWITSDSIPVQPAMPTLECKDSNGNPVTATYSITNETDLTKVGLSFSSATGAITGAPTSTLDKKEFTITATYLTFEDDVSTKVEVIELPLVIDGYSFIDTLSPTLQTGYYTTTSLAFISLANPLLKLHMGDGPVNEALTDLDCTSNQLSGLDLTRNIKLKRFYCANNKLSSLNLTNNTDLLYLQCYSNQLSSLDLTANTDLETLQCFNNPLLTQIKIGKTTAITNLVAYSCPLLKDIYSKMMSGTQDLSDGGPTSPYSDTMKIHLPKNSTAKFSGTCDGKTSINFEYAYDN